MICAKDDSGTTCEECYCMFNPIVVIATHERVEITTININLLKQQSVVPKIVIVCSLQEELEYYKTLGVTVILENNTPLGHKWQMGVNAAINMKANPLIILGSDDLLYSDYVKLVLTKMKEGYDFFGCTSWYSYDLKRHDMYFSMYVGKNENFPIGSGKAYSGEMLARFRGKVFNQEASRKLDDQGYTMVVKNQGKIYIHREPEILAIKGGWMELNPIEAYMRVPTIHTIRTDTEMLKRFNYDYTPNKA